MDDATIKNNLEKKRNELGLSQTEMARRLEISLNAYRKLEKREDQNPERTCREVRRKDRNISGGTCERIRADKLGDGWSE